MVLTKTNNSKLLLIGRTLGRQTDRQTDGLWLCKTSCVQVVHFETFETPCSPSTNVNHKTQEHTVQTPSAWCLFFFFSISHTRKTYERQCCFCFVFFNMTHCIDYVQCVCVFSFVLKSSRRTCYFLKSLHTETGPFPNRSKSTFMSSMERRNAVSLSTSSTPLTEVFIDKYLCIYQFWSFFNSQITFVSVF